TPLPAAAVRLDEETESVEAGQPPLAGVADQITVPNREGRVAMSFMFLLDARPVGTREAFGSGLEVCAAALLSKGRIKLARMRCSRQIGNQAENKRNARIE